MVEVFGICLFLCHLISAISGEIFKSDDLKSLQLLHVVFRHGDRTPISLYPNDPNLHYKWPVALGELTVLGKYQHYRLGMFLRERYKNFLTENPEEVIVRSSGKNRCLESAECNLAAMYLPKSKWVWNKDLNWQPVPIQTVPLSDDNLLYTDSPCPEAEKEEERIKGSPNGQKYINEHKELFEYLSNYSGTKVSFWKDVDYLYNTIWIEKKYNLTIPSWAIPVWDEMNQVTSDTFYWEFSTKLIQRLRAGPLIGEITNQMLQKAKGQLSDQIKVYMYSSHDTLIAAVLNALGVFNGIAPPYCATIVFELHSDGYQDHTVRILYLNTSDPTEEPQQIHLLKLSSCSKRCQLGKFVQLTRDIVPLDWKKECGLVKQPPILSQQAIIIIVVLGIPLLILLIVVSVLLWRYCCQDDDGFPYQLVPTV
ncbi:prostatic acid phosphatase-like [Centruroides sculpturatus]|uniref:prostatic acid phosphatase-like n=1 Tax=Centruroides sculpturatus TaxID=218467 RepID=UPI000C6D9C16|nr:prostatic acid phosphatase-like [Centruroides sculpturatus]